MDISNKDITLHPHLLDMLFAYKSDVNEVFSDVLGLYDINHIAISHINKQNQLLVFSSTPALEFNLFRSPLWRFDQTYQARWYELCTHAPWQTLYTPEYHDDLYYLKQERHQYPLGISLAVHTEEGYFIYSIARNKDDLQSLESFKNNPQHFYKIGRYCSDRLAPLFVTLNKEVGP